MAKNSKSTMVSARVPVELIGRVDFAVRNTTSENVNNRSDAVAEALANWADGQEQEFKRLGIEIPKTR